MDTSAFTASIISQLLAARPDWAFLNFWQVSDIMKDRTRFPAPQPTTDDNARSNTIPMDQTPPSFKYINGPDVPYVYREVLPTPLKRANFVEGLPHLKCKFGPLPPGELSPTKSYSSFDSGSVVYEALRNLPTPPPRFKELLEAEGPGIGGKGDYEPLDREMEGRSSRAFSHPAETFKALN